MNISKELKLLSDPKVADRSRTFFKTGKGDYAEDDIFIGIKMPALREFARNHYVSITQKDIANLLNSRIHEERMSALLVIMLKYKKAKTETEREKLYKFYVRNFSNINNWDLVDVSCPHIIGDFLLNRDRSDLYKWVKSKDLWTRRIAIVSTWTFIRKKDLNDTFKLAKLLLHDKEDLIHKAAGWMLREAGKVNSAALMNFINDHYTDLPRTTLRYAIEKFPESKRKKILKGQF